MKNRIVIYTIILCFILSSCNYSPKKIGVYSGTIYCKEYDIPSQLTGTIDTLYFEDGDKIKESDIICKIENTGYLLQAKEKEYAYIHAKEEYSKILTGNRQEKIAEAKAMLDASIANLDSLEKGTRYEEIEKAKALLKQSEDALLATQSEYSYILDTYNRYSELYKQNSISKQEYEKAKKQFDQASAALNQAKNGVEIAMQQLNLLKNGPTKETIRQANSQVEKNAATYNLLLNGATEEEINIVKAKMDQTKTILDYSQYILDKTNIKSPINGTLLEQYYYEGEQIFSGNTFATIADLSNIWLTIYVEEKYYSKLSLHDLIDVSIDGCETPQEGEIIYISNKTEFTPKNTETKEYREDTVFEVKIKLLNPSKVVKPGMTGEVKLWNTP